MKKFNIGEAFSEDFYTPNTPEVKNLILKYFSQPVPEPIHRAGAFISMSFGHTYCYCTDISDGNIMPTEEFINKIKDFLKTKGIRNDFTLADLKDGMIIQTEKHQHVVLGRSLYIKTTSPIAPSFTLYALVSQLYNDDLTTKSNCYNFNDIQKVFYMGELIWERTVDKLDPVRVQYSECQQKLNELQQQMSELEKQLNK